MILSVRVIEHSNRENFCVYCFLGFKNRFKVRHGPEVPHCRANAHCQP